MCKKVKMMNNSHARRTFITIHFPADNVLNATKPDQSKQKGLNVSVLKSMNSCGRGLLRLTIHLQASCHGPCKCL